ncbi:hypothetical protein ACTXOW_13005 [Corynebacterium variabile]
MSCRLVGRIPDEQPSLRPRIRLTVPRKSPNGDATSADADSVIAGWGPDVTYRLR